MIKIIDCDRCDGRALSSILYYMGILTECVTYRELAAAYKGDGRIRAVIAMYPERCTDEQALRERLSTDYRSIPVYAVSSLRESDGEDGRRIYKRIYAPEMIPSEIIIDIMRREFTSSPIGTYRLSEICASVTERSARVGSIKLPYTKTEVMILRYMISAYPNPKSADDILKYCFRQSRQPESSSVRTHISVMNKKYRELFSRNLIESVPEEGYIISKSEIYGCTGEDAVSVPV